MEEQNKYQQYLHKVISRMDSRKGRGSDFDGYIQFICDCYKKRIMTAVRHILRYQKLNSLSDKQIRDELNDNPPFKKTHEDPVVQKNDEIQEIYWIALNRSTECQEEKKKTTRIDFLLTSKRNEFSDHVLWGLTYQIFSQIHDGKMAETAYNYLLNTSATNILLRFKTEVESRGVKLSDNRYKSKFTEEDCSQLIKKLA